jgi:hypothetical protein
MKLFGSVSAVKNNRKEGRSIHETYIKNILKKRIET